MKKIDDKTKRNIIYLCIKIVVIIIIFIIMFYGIFGMTIMNNQSMKPAINEGELLIFYRLDKDYKRGDVVVANVNNKISTYRIVGLPNDVIDISNDGEVTVNKIIEKSEIFYNTFLVTNSTIQLPYTVPNNEYFLLNDYRESIQDSRLFGSINKKNIKGKVFGSIQIRDF